MKGLKINPKRVKKKLVDFIMGNVHNCGFERAVIGLSGGLDSTTTAYLAAEALGPPNLLGVIMPYKTTPKADIADAKYICKNLGIRSKYIDITDMVDAYFKKIPPHTKSFGEGSKPPHQLYKNREMQIGEGVNLKNKIRRGNKMARERMSILYDLSFDFNALVLGTSNRTEILLGYGTIYGDIACALNPMGGLYKCQVIQLAKFLKIPASIINKIPSAGFWKGQTDEGELGFIYKDVDKLLSCLIDKKYTSAQLIRKGFDKDFVYKVKQRIKKNRFKRQLPKIARI
ncbi:MAG: NAD(+) synthase [Candidatus Omnitrophota bacterium]|nr:MAG: NAD(+) synthase [Candidatus Omnitrophota bacterium]